MGKLKVHPLFIVLCGLSIAFGYANVFFVYLCAILLHEIGHSRVAKRLGYSLNNFCLLPQGALVYGFQKFRTPSDEIKIAAAGPIVNIILVVLCIALWWLVPDIYSFTENWVFCNLGIAIFNLLPIMPLDGGRIFLALFTIKHKRKLGLKFVNIFGLCVSFFCFAVFIYSLFIKANFSYLIMSIFLFTGVISSGKEHMYVNIISLYENKLKNAKTIKTNSIVIDENKQLVDVFNGLSKSKFNILYVANEQGEIVAKLFEPEILLMLETKKLSTKVRDALC